MKGIELKKKQRKQRKKRIRGKISGTSLRPRITINRTNKHLYTQVVDDAKGHTIVQANNLEKELKSIKGTTEDAGKLGEELGKRLKAKKIKEVVFDRNGYPYHGVVKAVAEGIRKAGIKL